MAGLTIVSATNPDVVVRTDWPKERIPIRRSIQMHEATAFALGDVLEDARHIEVITSVRDYGGTFWADLDALLLAARTVTSLTVNAVTINVHGLLRVTREARPSGYVLALTFIRSGTGAAMPGGYDTFPTDPTGSGVVAPDSARHQHTADNVTIVLPALTVADSTHAIVGTSDVTLVAMQSLVVSEATHAHTGDNVVLVENIDLVVADSTHGHTADNLDLGPFDLLQETGDKLLTEAGDALLLEGNN